MLDNELTHLEYFIHQAVAAALQGKPDTDLWVSDALAIIDYIKGEGQ